MNWKFNYNSGQAPYRLNQLIKPHHMVHSYGTRNRNNCYIPYRSSRLGQYSLSFQGPKIWNSIDNKTKDTKSVFFLLKRVLGKNFFLSRTMTVVAKNSPINNHYSFQSLLLLHVSFIRLLLSIN